MIGELWIYDVIGEGFFESGVTDISFRDELSKFDKTDDILVHVNSPGGDVRMATAIKTMLDQWKGNVTIQIDGMAASAASYIAMTNAKVVLADAAGFMIHNPWTIAAGDAREMRKSAEVLDMVGVKLAEAYARRSGKTVAEISKMMEEETWLYGDAVVEAGFADEVIKETAMACAIPKAFGFKHPPQPAAEPKQRPTNGLAAKQRQLDLARLL